MVTVLSSALPISDQPSGKPVYVVYVLLPSVRKTYTHPDRRKCPLTRCNTLHVYVVYVV